MDLSSLRHTAKEILALATLELFPGVELLEGSVDEIGFSYSFLLSKEMTFSERELLHLEDRMIALIQEDRPIKALEMMRENGAHYLEHLKQPHRAQAALKEPLNIITLIEIGSYRDLCPAPFLATTGELKAFKLQGFESEGKVVKIYGTAFFERDELKKFLKKYKEAAKRDPLVIGPKKDFFLPFQEEWIYLPKGEQLLRKLQSFWEEEHGDFERITFSDKLEKKAAHEWVHSTKKWDKMASLSRSQGDFVSIWCRNEKELFEARISSLHFIEKAFKIFGFESRISSSQEERFFSICVVDSYGRERALSYIEVEKKKRVVYRSLFHSLQNWIAHMIEMGVES